MRDKYSLKFGCIILLIGLGACSGEQSEAIPQQLAAVEKVSAEKSESHQMDGVFVEDVVSSVDSLMQLDNKQFGFQLVGISPVLNNANHPKAVCQNLGNQGLLFSQEKLFNQTVGLLVVSRDQQQLFGDVNLHQRWFSELLLENGLAKLDPDNAAHDKQTQQKLVAAELIARENKFGIWGCQ